jgi:hypothetical protein
LLMTGQRFLKTKLLTGLPSAVAGLAAIGAMTLVQREWAAQVGLVVYFPVLLLIGDRINGERLERWLECWRNDAVRGRKPSLCRKLYGRINAKVTTAAAILNMANVRMIKIASCLRMFSKIHSAPAGGPGSRSRIGTLRRDHIRLPGRGF